MKLRVNIRDESTSNVARSSGPPIMAAPPAIASGRKRPVRVINCPVTMEPTTTPRLIGMLIVPELVAETPLRALQEERHELDRAEHRHADDAHHDGGDQEGAGPEQAQRDDGVLAEATLRGDEGDGEAGGRRESPDDACVRPAVLVAGPREGQQQRTAVAISSSPPR